MKDDLIRLTLQQSGAGIDPPTPLEARFLSMSKGHEMKITVATTDASRSDRVALEAACAPEFQIYDDQATLLEVIHNAFLDKRRLVGIRVAKLLVSNRIEFVIAGGIGAKFS